MQSCGFKLQCPEPDSITSWLNSGREMKKPLDTYQDLPAKKLLMVSIEGEEVVESLGMDVRNTAASSRDV